ncbi:F-box protein At2g40925-like, partial [Capsicum annuum]|uniref:F-box protein At2g40925-like n=1 Tax=Capsicum annuum TaxID=4072 RepID=UPI001FB0CBF1
MKKTVIPNNKGKRVMKHSEINKRDVDGTMEILSRLPVRSLLRFKSVSKFWMTLISEPYFTLKHLNRAKNDQNSQRFLFNALRKYKNLIVLQMLNYGVASYIVVMIAWRLSGFIIIVIIPINFVYGTNPPENQYEILTLKSGSWRLTNKYPIGVHPELLCTDSLVFVHGTFHWINDITRFTVTALSISGEVYREIPLPEQMLSIYNQTWGVSVLTEKLCAYAHYTSQTFRFWSYRNIGLRMVNCYSAEEIWLFILSLGHPKDHLDYVLNLIPLRK